MHNVYYIFCEGCPYVVETFGRQEWGSPKSHSQMVIRTAYHFIDRMYCEQIHQLLYSNMLTLIHYSSLGPLVGKVKEYHIESIIDNLCQNMLSTNEQLRDISSIGEAQIYIDTQGHTQSMLWYISNLK